MKSASSKKQHDALLFFVHL